MAQDVIAKTLRLSDYPNLLDWAERARGYLESYIDDCKIYEGTEGLVTDMLKLLEELPK